jgi:putative tricarboxylic transport membrane protein
MQLSDRVTGLFMVTLGGLAAYGGSLLPPVHGQQIGPSVFPVVVGLGLSVCGALIVIGVGRHQEDQAEADLARVNEQIALQTGDVVQDEPVSWGKGLMALIPPGLLLFYVLAVDRLGFLPVAAIMVTVTAKALGASWRLAMGMAVAGPLFVNLVFAKLLRVPLPSGLLSMPWAGLP